MREMPEEQLVSVIHYMRTFQQRPANTENHYLTDALTGILPPDIDFEAERRNLLEKKYAAVD
ncbi:MAG: hypothetical protein IJ741_01330 [Schwartzia sp.]|nr:hypothetical protein [Schwartzia sp. (in: firmicutes)]